MYETRFSDVFDPIIPLRKWLEAMTNEPYLCGFSYDNEGEEILWSFTQLGREKGIFCVANNCSGNENSVYIVAYAEQKQVVRGIYYGFMNFFKSELYKAEEWETEYGGHSPEMFQSKIVETYLSND